MKAWTVTEIGYEGNCMIVFAETRGRAQAIGASQMDRDFLEISVRRSKQYDCYAEKGEVPVEILIEHGWYWGCHKCCNNVDQDAIDHDGAKIIDGLPYCGKCAARETDND